MLIEKTISKGDVVSFKLASGEEVVAKIDQLTDDKYIVTKPLMLTICLLYTSDAADDS